MQLIFCLFSVSNHLNNLDGQVMVFIITLATCKVSVGLVMVVAIFRRYGTIKTDFSKSFVGNI